MHVSIVLQKVDKYILDMTVLSEERKATDM